MKFVTVCVVLCAFWMQVHCRYHKENGLNNNMDAKSSREVHDVPNSVEKKHENKLDTDSRSETLEGSGNTFDADDHTNDTNDDFNSEQNEEDDNGSGGETDDDDDDDKSSSMGDKMQLNSNTSMKGQDDGDDGVDDPENNSGSGSDVNKTVEANLHSGVDSADASNSHPSSTEDSFFVDLTIEQSTPSVDIDTREHADPKIYSNVQLRRVVAFSIVGAAVCVLIVVAVVMMCLFLYRRKQNKTSYKLPPNRISWERGYQRMRNNQFDV